MHALSPHVYKWVNDAVSNSHGVPRPFTKIVKEHSGSRELVGCEIGFGFGVNAENLLKELSINRLFCVDPYIGNAYKQGNRVIDAYTKEGKSRFNTLKHDERVRFVNLSSSEAAQTVLKNKVFDFVYIDGNHSKEFVQEDLELYYDLVKVGGFIGGHDYLYGQEGVVDAVQEFALHKHVCPQIRFPDFCFQVT
jgi:hypothetical protein